MIVMLEDEIDRLERFERILGANHADIDFEHWRTAPAFIDAFSQLPCVPRLICLDHDLFVWEEDEPDPGDGRDVAAFLAKQTPVCPIRIHSTNGPAADSMYFTLQEAGWDVDKIAPIGEDWIEAYWYPSVAPLLDSSI